MTEKKRVLLHLGSLSSSKVIGEIEFVAVELGGHAVKITIDQKNRQVLLNALEQGDVSFSGMLPSILDYYSDESAHMPSVRRAFNE